MGVRLEQGLEEGQLAIDLFFDNKFAESREIAQRHCDGSIYHALGYGTFHYLRAVMTFDQEHIEHASTVLTQSVATIDRFRRKTGGLVDTLGKFVKMRPWCLLSRLGLKSGSATSHSGVVGTSFRQ